MRSVLEGELRKVAMLGETRIGVSDSDTDYIARVSEGMRASRAQIAWLCLPPGRHIPLILRGAFEAGLHAIVEKPWLTSRKETEDLIALGNAKHLRAGVHFEYCLHHEVELWRRQFAGGAGLRFGGRFGLDREDHTGLPPVDNLGCHFIAVRNYAVPEATIENLQCEYRVADERRVWLKKGDAQVASIDFLENQQPIIQRFLARFERAIDGTEFPWDLSFGLHVAEELAALRARTPQPAQE